MMKNATTNTLLLGVLLGGLLGLALPSATIRQVAQIMPAPALPPTTPTQADVPESFMARAREYIEKREYWASPSDKGLQAPNRAQKLRSYFSDDGITIVDREAKGSPELLKLNYAGVYRGEQQVLAVKPGAVSHKENRVEIDRGEVLEWYVNSKQGLEQGFDIATRPAGEGVLRVLLDVPDVTLRQSGEALKIKTATGRILSYGKLKVFDAERSEVPSYFKLMDQQTVALVVDDTDATYPLSIDPLLSASYDALLEGDLFAWQLGYGLASAGDVNGDGYDDVAVVATSYVHVRGTGVDGGAVLIFHGGPGGVGDGFSSDADTILEFPGFQFHSDCHNCVASAGDVNNDGYGDIVVGKPYYSDEEEYEGAVFVFHGSASGIPSGMMDTANALLVSNQKNARFGFAVASAGDVNKDGYDDVIATANYYTNGEVEEGAAAIFLGGAGGIGHRTLADADTLIESNIPSMRMGITVAGTGDVNGDGYDDILLGAHLYDVTAVRRGGVFVYHGSAGGIADGSLSTADAKITYDRKFYQEPTNVVGIRAASAGDVNGDGYADIILAGHWHNLQGTDVGRRGMAFILHGGPDGVGDGDLTEADTLLKSDQQDAAGGLWNVASAGDVNGDGYSDVILGSPGYALGELSEGAAFIFYGSALGVGDNLVSNADVTIESNIEWGRMGRTVASAGDVNNDGYSDVLVGVMGYQNDPINAGAVFVYHGNEDRKSGINFSPISRWLTISEAGQTAEITVTLDATPTTPPTADVTVSLTSSDPGECVVPASVTIPAAEWAAGVKVPVTPVDDTVDDGDQVCTIYTGISSSADANFSAINPPDVKVVNKDDDSIAPEVDGFWESNHMSSGFGISVASAGYVNGDEYADIIVGAPFFDNGVGGEGAVFIFYGSKLGVGDGPGSKPEPYILNEPVTQIEGNQYAAQLGKVVASAGDVNGDGFDDVIVSSQTYDNETAHDGAAFVFHGSPKGIPNGGLSDADGKLEARRYDLGFGHSVSSAGDVNGDGYDDVVVSAPYYNPRWPSQGAVYVFHGGPGGVGRRTSANADTFLRSDTRSNFNFGISVASAGDVNGDNVDDLVVRPARRSGFVAFAYHGSPGGIPSGNYDIANAQITSRGPPTLLGTFASSAGDVNNDGYDDVIVGGNYYYTSTIPHEGMALVFHGSANGIVANASQANADATITFDQLDTQTNAGASAGDFNGDGIDDIIVGAYKYDNGETDEGAAFVFYGSASGIGVRTSAQADVVFDSDQPDSKFGWSLAPAGDVNGDGNDDVVVGAYHFSNGEYQEGAAFIFHGGGNGAGGPGPQPVPDVLVDPINGLTTTEAGGTAEFTVSLNTQPSAEVSIPLSTSNPAECNVPASVTIAVADWSTGVPVTITGVDDALDDGDQPCTVITGPASSADPDYDGLDPADVDVINLDDEIGTADLQLLLSDSLDPGFPATPFTYTTTLSNLGPDDAADALLTVNLPPEYTVTAAAGTDWICSILASVVSCSNPLLASGASSAVNIDVSSSIGGSFTVDATVTSTAGDPDTANNSASETTTINSGPEFTSTQADVVVKVGELFSYTAQGTDADGDAVTISVVDAPTWLISTANPDGSLTLEGTVPAGQSGSVWPVVLDISDGTLNGTPQSFTITPAGINVNPVAGLVTGEDGTTDTFVVTLDSQPTADVVLALISSDTGECDVPNSVTISAGAWSTGVSVTVSGVDDPFDDDDQPCTIQTGASTSGDANFTGIDPADVDVTNIDDDTAEADLSVTFTDSADPVLPGTAFSYTATVTNNGTWDALDVALDVSLPVEYSVTAAGGAGWICSVATGIVSCTNPLLAIGATAPVTVDVSSATANFFNVDVDVSSATLDPVLGNNTISETTLVNTPPVAVPPALPVAVVEDTPTPITLAGTDADGHALTYEVVTSPANGTMSDTAPNLIYAPSADYFGPDTFTYRVFDGYAYSLVVTVDLFVSNVNDAPYFVSSQADVIVSSGATFTYTAVGADVDGDVFTILATQVPNWLTATTNADGSLTLEGIVPNGPTASPMLVMLDITDGLLAGAPQSFTITINSVPTAKQDRFKVVQGSGPVELDVLGNDSDKDGDALSIIALGPVSDGISTASIVDTPLGQRINFVLDPGATSGGKAISFDYTISDGNGGTDTATVNVQVSKK